MSRMSSVPGLAMAVWAFVAPVGEAVAEPVQGRAEYSVTLAGFPVAYLNFVTEVDGGNYSISGTMRTSALSDMFSKTRGNASVSGALSNNSFQASRFSVAYTSGKKAQRTEIEFSNGDVKSATNTPERRKKGADWVPVLDKDLRAVLDPLSGLVLPASARACPRSLPIYDGQSRVTLHLSPKGVRPFRTKGFKGDAVVCGIRFEPKAGYRKGSSAIKYLKKLKSMEVWFAKYERGGYYAPVRIKVPTKIGQVTVTATRFGD